MFSVPKCAIFESNVFEFTEVTVPEFTVPKRPGVKHSVPKLPEAEYSVPEHLELSERYSPEFLELSERSFPEVPTH